MDISSYIIEQALILIPVLYILGMFLKSSAKIPDKFIPVILLVIGILLAFAMLGFSVQSFIQGVLVSGAAVFTNEIITQLKKDE